MRCMTAMLVVLLAGNALAEEAPTAPSIKDDFKEVGRAIDNTSKDVYDKTKDATTHGVGTALQKTGEGLDKAAEGVDHAGEKVKDQ